MVTTGDWLGSNPGAEPEDTFRLPTPEEIVACGGAQAVMTYTMKQRAILLREYREWVAAGSPSEWPAPEKSATQRAKDAAHAIRRAILFATDTDVDVTARPEPIPDAPVPPVDDLQGPFDEEVDSESTQPVERDHDHDPTGWAAAKGLPRHRKDRPSRTYDARRARTIREKADRLGIPLGQAEAMTPVRRRKVK